MEGQVYKFEVSRRKTGNLALEPIQNGQQACEFCFKHLDGLIKEWRETSVGIYLDKEHRALGYEVISEGTADACLFDTKQLIRSACLVGANFVIVAHNHPSGNCRPSKLDIEQAEKIRRGLHAAGLILLDFVIMTEGGEGYTMCDERVIKCEKTPEKRQETQQPEVDLKKEIDACWRNWISPSEQKEVEGVLPKTEFAMYARHFYELGLNARKEENK